jgi:hypothetical protein
MVMKGCSAFNSTAFADILPANSIPVAIKIVLAHPKVIVPLSPTPSVTMTETLLFRSKPTPRN